MRSPVTYLVLAVAASPFPAVTQTPRTLDRELDPVIMTGADVAGLCGSAPGDLVAFRYAGGWEQIPVQVDERAEVDFDQVYNQPPSGVMTLVLYSM